MVHLEYADHLAVWNSLKNSHFSLDMYFLHGLTNNEKETNIL